VSSVDVYQEADGRWRWEYRDEKVALKSNRTYGDADSAIRAARTAYPEQFNHGSGSGQASRGLVGKVSFFLTIALAVVVWRRRRRSNSLGHG
jgi:hypothetical protein